MTGAITSQGSGIPYYAQSPYSMLSPKGPIKIKIGSEMMVKPVSDMAQKPENVPKPAIVDLALKLNLNHKMDSEFEPSPHEDEL